jgi:hypothetical protein
MFMNRLQVAAGFVIACSLFVAPSASRAQQAPTADTYYSAGVEAYYRGCSAEAESQFSTLMAVDPNDPRAFYFRALCLIRQGRSDEACSDMQIGAELESRSPHRFDIGKTLERIQGPTRLMLEQYRNRAHQLAGNNPSTGPARVPDAAVLRERRFVPLDAFASPGDPQSIAAPPQTFESAPVVPPAATKPAESTTSQPPNPFGDDPNTTTTPPKQLPTPPPAKAAAPPKAPPAKAPLPPAPKETPPAPKPSDDDSGNPF